MFYVTVTLGEYMKQATIVIPALNPDNAMLRLLEGLKKLNDYSILIINDGSNIECESIFEQAKRDFSATIITHPKNMGKGAALKTAFEHIIKSNIDGIIATVDADGQHSFLDIHNCIQSYIDGNVLLGVRHFSKEIPLRSYIGNVLTKLTMRTLTGVDVSDTQTGLRVFNLEGLKAIAKLKGDRYEFESTALITWKNSGFKFQEIEIATIYDDNNSSSHFNPIMDSIRIYRSFFKYALSSLSSSFLDLGLFHILVILLPFNSASKILYASFLARIVSGFYNYNVNSKFVFKSSNKFSGLSYIALAISQIVLSTYLLVLASNILGGINPTLLKVLVDTLVFIISFLIQKGFIFKPGVKHEKV